MITNFLYICSGGSARGALKQYLAPLGNLTILHLFESLNIELINEIQNNILMNANNIVIINNNLNDKNAIKKICDLLNSHCLNKSIKIIGLMDPDLSLHVDYFLTQPFLKQEVIDLIAHIKHEIKITNTINFYNIINNNIKLIDLPIEKKIKI